MTVDIILTEISSGNKDEVLVQNIDNKHSFIYADNNDDICEINIFERGLCLNKKSKEYLLELNLNGENYAKITTAEGEIKLDAKVVDFIQNDDILVVRYIIGDEMREIRLIYRS